VALGPPHSFYADAVRGEGLVGSEEFTQLHTVLERETRDASERIMLCQYGTEWHGMAGRQLVLLAVDRGRA